MIEPGEAEPSSNLVHDRSPLGDSGSSNDDDIFYSLQERSLEKKVINYAMKFINASSLSQSTIEYVLENPEQQER